MDNNLSKAGRRVAQLARAINPAPCAGGLFKKLLVVNRGEIACRLFRAAKALNIPTVAIYAAADKAALHIEVRAPHHDPRFHPLYTAIPHNEQELVRASLGHCPPTQHPCAYKTLARSRDLKWP